jgi:hypothetical protein
MPQHFAVPFDNNAQVWRLPAVMAVASLTDNTDTGVVCLEVVPSPN